MELKPSEICYSQDSIMNKFGDYTQHGDTLIGETLDQLLCGQCNLDDIPEISVVDIDGEWFTTDNRRLWVFRKAEELGFLKTIEVGEKSYIKEDKMTTDNGGTSVRVRGRGGPGGRVWKTWKPKPRKRPNRKTRNSKASYNSNYPANSISKTEDISPYKVSPTESYVRDNHSYFSSQTGLSNIDQNLNFREPYGSRNYNNSISSYEPPNSTGNQAERNWSNITSNQTKIINPTPEVYSSSRYNYASDNTRHNRYTDLNPSIVNTESDDSADEITPRASTGYHTPQNYNADRVSGPAYTMDFNYRETNNDQNCCCVIL